MCDDFPYNIKNVCFILVILTTSQLVYFQTAFCSLSSNEFSSSVLVSSELHQDLEFFLDNTE